jgi:nitrilase
MGDRLGTVRAAVVQAPSRFLDREQSVADAVRLIETASREGADVVVFPEGFIPAHPGWYHFHGATSRQGRQLGADLFRNAVVVGGDETTRLGKAAHENQVWAVVGLCEKRPGTTGTMWNSAVHVAPDGRIAAVHRKLTPTVGERIVHAVGNAEGLELPEAPFGSISSLLCAENFNPLLVFSIIAQHSLVHTALWPSHFSPNAPRMRETIEVASRAIAYQSGAYVLSAAGVLDEEAIERVGATEADRLWLRDSRNQGGSCIVAPSGEVLAQADGEETILLADLDLDRIINKSLIHDYAGHYNRSDIFTLLVDSDDTGLFNAPWNRSVTSSGHRESLLRESSTYHDVGETTLPDGMHSETSRRKTDFEES